MKKFAKVAIVAASLLAVNSATVQAGETREVHDPITAVVHVIVKVVKAPFRILRHLHDHDKH